MTNEWDDYAEGWDNNPSVVEYAENAYASLTEKLNIQNTRILDFGCGTGQLTQKLSPQAAQIVALDPSQKMIDMLANKRLKNVVPIAKELDSNLLQTSPLLQQKFDLVVASSALAFVADYLQTLILLKGLLREKGYLVQWDWLKAEDRDGAGFSPQQVEEIYAKAGLELTSCQSPFAINSNEAEMPVLMAVGRN